MGKALKWFRRILGLKKTDDHHHHSSSKPPHKDKCRWSFVKSYREKDSSAMNNGGNNNAKWSSLCGDQQQQEDSVSDVDRGCEVVDSNKHAIAVAAATAAVAEAAVAAAQATEAVVRLISSSGGCDYEPAAHVSSSCGSREEFAAVKIQSAFRGYLARRALRALKGLVKLQALVRGHIERKRTAERLRRMQALLRAQVRARAGRAQISESSQSSSKFSHFHQPGNGSKSSGRTLDNNEKLHPGWNRSEHRINEQSWDQRVHSTRIGLMDDEKNDKILKVDVGKPHFTSKGRNLFQSTHLALNSDLYNCSFTNSRDSHQTAPSPSSGEVQSLSPLKFSDKAEESPFSNAYNGSQFYSASSKEGSCTAKSDGSRSYLSSYSDHPNYMAYTESSRAKLRSLSAPKQRPPYEKSSSTKRYSIYDFGLHQTSRAKLTQGQVA